MPKVLRIINRLNLGGPTFNAALLTKHLAPEYETMLVAGVKMDSEESSEFICKQMGIDYIQVPEMSREINFSKDRIAYKKIKKAHRRFQARHCSTQCCKGRYPGRLAAHNMNVPVIVHTFHGHIFLLIFILSRQKYFWLLNVTLLNVRRLLSQSVIPEERTFGSISCLRAGKNKVVPLGFESQPLLEHSEANRKSFRDNILC